jgi:hypothetical protein
VLSSRLEDFDAWVVVAFQESEQLAGDDAPEAALGVAPALAFGGAAGQVGAGVGIGAQAHQQDGVQGAVELAVAASVDSLGRLGVSSGPGGLVDDAAWGGQAGGGEGCLVSSFAL